MRIRSTVLALALAAAGACSDDQRPGTQWHPVGGGGGGGAPLTGAIFTTTEDGTRVDANIYDAQCDVYLNGGPAHEGAAGLPEGDYYFQVTDPSGFFLLSTDAVEERQFHVDGTGRISGLSGAGSHATGTNEVDGGVTVQLCPFLDTPNPGCEYKVWATRVSDYDSDADMGRHGFIQSQSKTDNFKVCEGDTPPDDDRPDGGMDDEEDPESDEQDPIR